MSRLKGLRTPVFWAEGHPGKLDRETWKIEVGGLCKKPMSFSWQELCAMPKTIADARLTSVTRFSVRGRWGGVKLSDILESVGVGLGASHVRFWSIRHIYDTSIPIAVALKE
ncbi:MAG TPA: molybdopterin-dependent oxidoreductase, partial [Syntrophorhabdales bacterium]|nr:molybdopterin-dependent oxidoreductase [Syntrophorhabdales bacterium]